MTTQEHTTLALAAIDGDDVARCYLAGYDVARSDIARRGHSHARQVLRDSRASGANGRWVAGYSRAVNRCI